MKNFLISYARRIGRYLLFLFLAFVIERTAFLLVNFSAAAKSSFTEVFATYFHAFHLDLSAACYMLVLPLIFLSLQLFFKKKWPERILDGYTLLVVIVLVFTALGNIILYKEWATKLNYKIWAYLHNPMEVVRTATWLQLTVGLLAGAGLTILYFWLYRHWFARPDIPALPRFRWLPFVLIIFVLPLNFVGMRGHIGGIPISQSSAYFSKNQVLNDAAVNTQWHLMKSTLRFGRSNEGNPYVFMPQADAEAIVTDLFRCEKDTCLKVLNTDHPNIVIILLESWSADLIESLGGEAGITPCFKELEKEGLLFTQVYAAGHRSQEGISSIISGFPPVPVVTITDNFEKYGKLASLAEVLKDRQYRTSFHFGGDLTYGNLRAYLMAMGFEHLVDEDAYPANTPHGKLSIYDEITFNHHLTELNKEKETFFSVNFTASTHSPYDVPQRTESLAWDVEELPYLHSAQYTDYCLGQYFAQAKQEAWYENTLFILVADHSHRTYRQWNYYDAGYQHIPMLWLGGALKEEFRGTTVDQLCSYLDLPLTLARQLDVPDTRFEWSKDILNPYSPQFAVYQTNYGIGWITPDGAFGYDATSGAFYQDTFTNDSLRERNIQNAKAFLQVLYQMYLDL